MTHAYIQVSVLAWAWECAKCSRSWCTGLRNGSGCTCFRGICENASCMLDHKKRIKIMHTDCSVFPAKLIIKYSYTVLVFGLRGCSYIIACVLVRAKSYHSLKIAPKCTKFQNQHSNLFLSLLQWPTTPTSIANTCEYGLRSKAL